MSDDVNMLVKRLRSCQAQPSDKWMVTELDMKTASALEAQAEEIERLVKERDALKAENARLRAVLAWIDESRTKGTPTDVSDYARSALHPTQGVVMNNQRCASCREPITGRAYFTSDGPHPYHGYCLPGHQIERALSTARAETRREALEEAAKVADGFRCGSCGMDGKAAAAIRALMEKENIE